MSWFSRAPERRRFPRFKANLPATASLVANSEIIPFRLRCDSISEGGVGAPDLNLLAVGDLVTLELHIPVSMQPIWVDTTVVRRSAGHCGFEFLSLSDDQRNLIKRYCQLQPKEKRRRWWSY